MSETMAGAEDALRHALDAEEQAAAAQQEPETFSRQYVQDLRREAAQYRTAARDLERAWDGVSEQDKPVWQQLIQLTSRDPQAGAAELKRIAEAMLEPEPAPFVPPADPQAPVDYAQVNRIVEERVRAQAEQTMIREIENEAVSLGYEVGTQDYIDLLWVAQNHTNADLREADRLIQEQRAQWVEQRVAELAETGQFVRPMRGGSAPSGDKPITNFEEAKASLVARLNQF